MEVGGQPIPEAMEAGVQQTPEGRKTMEAGGQPILEAIETMEAGVHLTLVPPYPTLRSLAVTRAGISRPLQVWGVGGAWQKSPTMHSKTTGR
jgi:hypothetical protein